jgi:uncharacterized protein
MKKAEIAQLATGGQYQGRPLRGRLLETHISWVILSGQQAFKIKKSLKTSFLDFSTLALRRHFCQQEVALNSRFTTIYQGVLPIRFEKDQWLLGAGSGPVREYAVCMKRLQAGKRGDLLLQQGRLTAKGLQALAGILADFHRRATPIQTPFVLADARQLFADIEPATAWAEEQLGPRYSASIGEAIALSNDFLEQHAGRLQQRIAQGYKRDVHGDLHFGNIFMYARPILFDCIEFRDDYRQIDLLYEIAFLCMDLEAYEQPQLASSFLAAYTSRLPCFEEPEDWAIFEYFKGLRANIRAKVHALAARQAHSPEEREQQEKETARYLQLMLYYLRSASVQQPAGQRFSLFTP